ncbi:MAG: hypothetical protein ACLTXM_04110 [Enterococcus sp.]
MVRKFRVDIETFWAGINATDFFEVPDDATEEEIEADAKEIFMDYCSYGFSEVEEDGE